MSDLRVLFMAVAAAAFLLVALWAAWRLFFKGGTLRDAPSQTAPPPRRLAARELLRVERDPADGLVTIWLNGERVGHAGVLADDKLSEAVQALLSAITSPGADATGSAVIAPPVAPALQELAAPGPASAEASAAAPLDEDLHRPFLTRVRESMNKPRSYGTPVVPMAADAAKKDEQSEWMFASINNILQRMLSEQSGMPDIEITGAGSEIRFLLNGHTYTSLGEVPDERARELIRAAVAEWERT